ncbi:MAG: YdcF family protein [Proteobacteria bacterium]|nr:YdcF family protein [Pseudomonadota bacterium]
MRPRLFVGAPRGKPGRRRLALAFGAGLGLLASAWATGLLLFVDSIPRATPEAETEVDAIVVLTGGAARLKVGLALMAEKRAKKVFVSGVYRGVDVAELLRISRQSPDAVACCIAIGYSAESTRGNAAETAKWMAEQGFASLRLVTANYHMPRSLVEFRAAMPEVLVIAHPVIPEHVILDGWWRWPGTAALILGEYNKYLFAVIHAALSELGAAIEGR